MNKEVLFAQTLEQVRKTAKEQGNCISEEQVLSLIHISEPTRP